MIEFDMRIAQQELELARVQAEETTYCQIEANLARNALKSTLGTACVIAVIALDVIASLDANVQRMADDLTGGAR